MSLIKDFLLFAKSGHITQRNKSLKELHYSLIKLFILISFLKIIYIIAVNVLENIGIMTLPKEMDFKQLNEYGPYLRFGIYAFFLPIMEEITFRLGLIFSKRNFAIMASGFILVILRTLINLNWTIVLIIAFVIGVTLYFLIKDSYTSKLTKFWKKNRLLIFYTLLFAFAILHITNYELNSKLLLYLPLVVLPHLIAGFVFSYARLKYGFSSGVYLHIMNNAVPSLLILIAQ